MAVIRRGGDQYRGGLCSRSVCPTTRFGAPRQDTRETPTPGEPVDLRDSGASILTAGCQEPLATVAASIRRTSHLFLGLPGQARADKGVGHRTYGQYRRKFRMFRYSIALAAGLFVAAPAMAQDGMAACELERPVVAEFYQRVFGEDLPESSANLAVMA